jgi:GNAT superfamily N-acetyltransferase
MDCSIKKRLEKSMIQPFLPEHTTAVSTLLKTIWVGEDSYVSSLPEQNLAAFVWLESGEVLGFANLFAKTAHPKRDYLGLHVHPQARRRSIGSSLLSALEPHLRGFGLQTITPFLEAQAFLARRGFYELMQTHTPRLELERVQLEPVPLPTGYEFLPYHESMRLQVARLHDTVYAQQHTWNITAQLSDENALETFMGEDVLPEVVSLIGFEGVPVAFSSLRGEVPELELAWFGVLEQHAAAREVLTKALLLHQIGLAKGLGANALLAELDSLIPEAKLALECLPFEDSVPWVTMTRPLTPA